MNSDVLRDAVAAKAAAGLLSSLDSRTKDDALERMASALEGATDRLYATNQKDVDAARALLSAGRLKESAYARLSLNSESIPQMARSIRAVRTLGDPVGRVLFRTELDDNLELKKVTCPFGVLAAIVEARPDAVVQLAALALKSGNALMIKAGAEISHTSGVIVRILQDALTRDETIPREALTNVCGREAVMHLLKLAEFVDLVIPRGSAELIRVVRENTRIPVLGHSDGVCHIYVHSAADIKMAINVILDSKTQAPSTCNAVETVLVDRALAGGFLPLLTHALRERGVQLRGCETAVSICGQDIGRVEATEWHTEYGALTLAIRVIDGCKEAVAHINQFGSHHTDCIITEDAVQAERFSRAVDSAGVFQNVSTRFSDGYRYGLGAEVGISTGKLHARGPVGLDGLVTYKYILSGSGQCVSQYIGQNARRFKHEGQSLDYV